MGRQAGIARIEIRLGAGEKARLEARARACGLGLGEFLRRAADCYDPAPAAAGALSVRLDELAGLVDGLCAENAALKARVGGLEALLELPRARARRGRVS